MKIVDKISFSKISDPIRGKDQLRGMGPGYDRSLVSLQATDGRDWKTLIGPESVTSLTGIQYDDEGNAVAHNLIPNSEGVGGAVGVLPTGWTKNDSGGVVVSIVEAGNGYEVFRFLGTSISGSYAKFTPYGLTASAPGLTFTGNAIVEILDGVVPSGCKLALMLTDYNSSSGYLNNGETAIGITDDTQITHTTPANTAFISFYVEMYSPSGKDIDITVKISRPQLSKSATKLAYVPTYGNPVFMPYVSPTKGLRASGAWTNDWFPGGQDFSTGFTVVNSTVTTDGIYKRITATKDNDYARVERNKLAGTWSISCIAKRGSCQLGIAIDVAKYVKFNLDDGTVAGATSGLVGNIKPLGNGEYLCSVYGTISVAGQAGYVVWNPARPDAFSSPGSLTGDYVLVRNPQITSGPYLFDYIPPGITSSASSSTTGGGGTNTLLNDDMLECLRGKTDGVELVVNGTLDTNIDGYVAANGATVVWDSGKLAVSGGTAYTSHGRTATFLLDAGRYLVKHTSYGSSSDGIQVHLSQEFGAGVAINTYATSSQVPVSVTAEVNIVTSGLHSIRLFPWATGAAGGTAYIDNISIQRLLPSVFTGVAAVWVGAGSKDLLGDGASRNVISCNNSAHAQDTPLYFRGDPTVEANSITAAVFDGASYAETTGVWNRDEIHLKVVQTNAAGTRFRAGNRRYTSAMVPIDALTWGAWAAYDGSMQPLTHLRLAINGTIPLGFKLVSLSNKSLSDIDILKQLRYSK